MKAFGPFTKQQLEDWVVYEKVRKGGRWNMYDPQAQRATRLSSEEYVFVMENYEALMDAVQAQTTKSS